MIQAVLFDVDDTLVDYSGAERAAIERYLLDLGVPPHSVPEGATTWHRAMERHFARYLDGVLDYAGQRRERARDMLAWLGNTGHPDDAALDGWFDGYRARYEQILAPFDDVPDCLDRLAGLRLGVVTNNDTAYQRAKLVRLGLADRFHCVIGTDLAGARKPDPAIFLAGCRALGVPAAQTAYVGDRLDHDAQGATEAGLIGIWLNRADAPKPGSAVPYMTSLAELPARLEVKLPTQAHPVWELT